MTTAVAYLHYRILVSESARLNYGYTAINEFELYESVDKSTPNLCFGATATASGVYQDHTTAAMAIDKNLSTFWESSNTIGVPRWLQVTLSEPKVVRAMHLASTQFEGEVPRNFKIQGSNNGSAWDTLREYTNWVAGEVSGGKSATELLTASVSGVSTLSSGGAADRVLLHNWNTGQLIKSIPVNGDGSWAVPLNSMDALLVTHIGPSGFQPISDGPVSPKVL